MAEKINNLGQYADLSAVWSRHPEGGREGDFVKIDGVEYLWDKVARNWVAGGSSQGGEQGQTVGGDLNVNGDLNVAGDASIGGTLHVNDIQVGNAGRFKGQSSFRMQVFTRSDSTPATPNGGEYSNPLPYGMIWHEGVPQGNKPMWVSSRTYTSDGQAPQGDWSEPMMLVDSEDFDVEFSNAGTDSVPAPPSSSNLGWLWFDPKRNPSADWQSMNWMATRYKSINAQGEVEWEDWVIVLIKGARGADGDGYENVFYRTKLKVAPTAVIDPSQFQTDDYCPAVGNKADCQGSASIGDNSFSDNPKGVSEEYPYEWTMKRRKHNGQWLSFSQPAVLWATYSKEHTVTISENGYWVIDGEETDKKAIGQGVAVKGRVDFYSTESTGYTSGSSTLEDITEPELGDSYVVEDNGHLYLCVATTGTLAEIWEDLGEFKGEKGDDGKSAFLYLAWATNVVFNNTTPQTFNRADGFTRNPAIGQNYPWMGIKVSNTEIPDNELTADLYKWNYLAGRDGTDYEYVYIRTKNIEPAPTIDPALVNVQGYQSPEYYPDVLNISQYTYQQGGNNNTIDANKFYDDPMGISEEWPYEWQSRRERINGAWGAFQSPAVLHRNWAEPGEDGNDGKDAVQIKTSKSVITVDADSNGQVASQLTLSLSCWLLVGGDITQILQSGGVTAKYGNDTLNSAGMPGQQGYILATESGHQARTRCDITIKLAANTALTNKDISVELTDGTYTASVTVPVAIVRRGADGNGQRGADGSSLVPCGEWESGKTYYWNSVRRDYVTRNGSYYVVNTFTGDNGSTTLGTPGSSNGWLNVPAIPAIATELLLAEDASIRLLSSNKLIFVDSNGHKTAGINEDGQGSYKTYYTDSPYGVRKDDNADGWTYYYNNDADNTLAWMLGPNGVIVRAGNVSMAAIKMSSEPISTPISYNPNLNVTVVDRYVYTGDDPDYKDKVYMTGALDNNAPSSAVVGDGTYSQTTSWIDRYDKDEDKYYHVLPLIRIFGGKITDRWEEKEEYQNPLNG